jgi:3-oxoacyl-[acyl-carrier-protein] synthase II
MGSKKAVIVGYDMVSPLGVDMDAQWERALKGESGVGLLTRFPVPEGFPVRIAGQVPDFDARPYPFLSPRRLAQWTSPIFKHGMLVAHRAVANSGIEITPDLSPRVAVTFSSAVGGQDAVLHADRRLMQEGKLPQPFTNPNSCINMIGGKVSILTNATGPITSTITACATGVTSIIVGAMFLEQGKADVALCGAVDFALVEPIVAGFATMNGAFRSSPSDPPDASAAAGASRPFSLHRHGFVVSEGAGCVVLASEEFARAHGLAFSVEVAGWSMTSDACHYVAPHLKTVSRCIAESIADAGIRPGDIQTVNAHAPSTKVGDQVEYEALKENFPGRIPPVTANKSLFGHAMGASSAIETILALRGMLTSTLPPTINYTPDPELELDVVPEGKRTLHQDFLLKNSFGFGGCNSCLVLHRLS